MHLSGAERIEQGLEARFHFDRYGTSELVPCYEDSAVGEAEIPWADEGSGPVPPQASPSQRSAIVMSAPPSIPDLLRADQPERRIVGKLLGVVHVFVSCQSAIDGLPQQVRKGEPRILCPSVRQVPVDKFAETQSFLQLPHQNQTSIGSDLRSLESDL